MTKYTVASQRRPANVKPQVDPIWRGVGCIMMIVVPVISFAAGAFTVDQIIKQGWPMPYQLMGYPVMPALLMRSAALVPILLWIEKQQNLYAILVLTVAYIVFFGAVISVAYAVVYRFVGPSRYGPLDARPEEIIGNRKIKRYKR